MKSIITDILGTIGLMTTLWFLIIGLDHLLAVLR